MSCFYYLLTEEEQKWDQVIEPSELESSTTLVRDWILNILRFFFHPAKLKFGLLKNTKEYRQKNMPRRNQEESHPDLFGNNADLIINNLLTAFREQNLYETERLIQRLSREHSSHSRLFGFQQLLEAQKKLKTPVEDIQHDLNELRDTIRPLALKWLGLGAQSYLAPLWQRLAQALKGQCFNPLNPKLHRSFVCGEASDWVGVHEAVENESDWHQHPTLALRLAKALYFLNELETATEIWFYLFWKFSAEATAAIESEENPNLALRERWRVFEDIEEEMNPVNFPAWMLLTDWKLLHYSFNKNLHVLSALGKNYHAIHQFLLLKQDNAKNPQDVELELRKALKQTDEKLLKWYLKTK